jgi:hypothetical protein
MTATDRKAEARRETNRRYNARRRASFKSLGWCAALGNAKDHRKGITT